MESVCWNGKSKVLEIKFVKRRYFNKRRIEYVEVEFRNFSLLISHLTMAANASEDTPMLKQPSSSNPERSMPFLSSKIGQLQYYTRGYLWFVVASLFLIVGAGIMLFPQTTWNRIMLALFGCVTLNVRGKQYNFCERTQQENLGPLI